MIGFVRVGDSSSCSSTCSSIEIDLSKIGDVGTYEGAELIKESRGRPSISGSGRVPNFELFEADRIRPADIDPTGDITNPPGEKPPDLAAELTSTIEDAFDICLEILAISDIDCIEDLRESDRFCSS